VVGAAIVHTDGVDFRLLGPPWLTIGLFVAIPGVHAALLTVLAERLFEENGWFAHAPITFATAPLTLWIPLAPLLGVLVLLWASGEGVRQMSEGPFHLRPRWGRKRPTLRPLLVLHITSGRTVSGHIPDFLPARPANSEVSHFPAGEVPALVAALQAPYQMALRAGMRRGTLHSSDADNIRAM